MFDFKCGSLKIYAVLELNCRSLYMRLKFDLGKHFRLLVRMHINL
jgi:hypothetical protein